MPKGEAQMFGETHTWTDPQTNKRFEIMTRWHVDDVSARPAIFQMRAYDDSAEISAAVIRRCLSNVDRWFEDSRTAAKDVVEKILKAKQLPDRLAEAAAPAPGPGRPREYGDDHYQLVASLYWDALQLGGMSARKPNKYVLAELRQRSAYDALLPVEDKDALGAVRRWVHKSRQLGFLPTMEQIEDARQGTTTRKGNNAKRNK